jgi:hypothetical protein
MYRKSPSGSPYELTSNAIIAPTPNITNANVVLLDIPLTGPLFSEADIVAVSGHVITTALAVSPANEGTLTIDALYVKPDGSIVPAGGITGVAACALFLKLAANNTTTSIFPFGFMCDAQNLGKGGTIRISARTNKAGDSLTNPQVFARYDAWF